jgi:hypothetical protein
MVEDANALATGTTGIGIPIHVVEGPVVAGVSHGRGHWFEPSTAHHRSIA